jgi:FHS family Na+ dependent glucose MFS transporter 1
MATRFTPRQTILVALLSCLSLLTLAIIIPGSGLALWIVAIGLGFCMAPIWPTGFTLAGQSLKLTARISGIILLGDSIGGMVLPWLVGQVIGVAGPRAMVYLVFGSLGSALFVFLGMYKLSVRSRNSSV